MGTQKAAAAVSDVTEIVCNVCSILSSEGESSAVRYIHKVFDELDNTMRDGVVIGDELLAADLTSLAKTVFQYLKTHFPASAAGDAGFARSLFKEGKWRQSARLWQECMNDYPDQRKVFWFTYCGNALMKSNDPLSACEIYRRGISEFPEYHQGYARLASALMEIGNWEAAMSQWSVCLERFPELINDSWLKKYQRTLVEMKEFGRAEEIALKRLPGENSAYSSLVLSKRKKRSIPSLKFNHILIVTYGRSGSTLLQGLLNSIPGVLIRGENNNFFYDLYKSYAGLTTVISKNKNKHAVLPNQPWFGIPVYDIERLIKNFQSVAHDLLISSYEDMGTDLVTGFKEIRYPKVKDDLALYLDFLLKIFPNAAIIFNTRNLDHVANSAFWKDQDKAQVIADLNQFEGEFSQFASDREDVFSLRYEDVYPNSQRVRELFDFLGAEYDQQVVQTVLKTPHSYAPEQSKIKSLFDPQ